MTTLLTARACSTASSMAASRPTSSRRGGRSWLMNVRMSPSSRRRSTRRLSQLGPASRGSVAITRSMNSTWKIAFERLWAGPSWISWASRDRSASSDSTIRIAMSAFVAGASGFGEHRLAAALEEAPRPLEGAQGEVDAAELGLVVGQLPDEPVDLLAQDPRPPLVDPDRRGRDRDHAAIARDAIGRGRLGAAPALEPLQVVAKGLPARELLVVRLLVALPDALQRARALADRGGRLLVETVEAVTAGMRLGACCLHGLRSIRVVSHGQTTSNARTSSRGSGPPPAGAPRSISRKQSAPSVAVSSTAGHWPWLAARDHEEVRARERRVVGQVEDVHGRLVGQGERRDPLALGEPDREVRDDRAGGRVERVAGDRPSAGRAPRRARPSRAIPRRRTAAARRRTGPTRRSRGAPRARPPGRVQPSRAPSLGDPGVEGQQRRDDQQHVGRPGRMEERAPRRRDREDEAREQERDHRQEQDRPQGGVAALPRQRQRAR